MGASEWWSQASGWERRGEGVARKGLGRATGCPWCAGLSGGACWNWSHRSFSPALALHTHLGFLPRRGPPRGQKSGKGRPRASRTPQPGPVHVTCPALPAPRRRVPGRGVVEQPGSSSSGSPGARVGARTAELSPGAKAEAGHPRGGAEPRAGAGERPAEAREARAPAHCHRPRAPRALGPAAKRVSGPVSPAGLRDARSPRYK